MEGELPACAQSLTDDCPFIAELVVQFEQFFLLPQSPIFAIKTGIQVVVVSEVMK